MVISYILKKYLTEKVIYIQLNELLSPFLKYYFERKKTRVKKNKIISFGFIFNIYKTFQL